MVGVDKNGMTPPENPQYLVGTLYGHHERVFVRLAEKWRAEMEVAVLERVNPLEVSERGLVTRLVKVIPIPSHDYMALCMPFVDGERLSEVNLSEEDVEEVARQLVEAVEALHKAFIVHRDIKPSNIMVRWRQATELPRVCLVDFDQASWCEDGSFMGSGDIGTVGFQAPFVEDHYRGVNSEYDMREADWWSLRLTLEKVCERNRLGEWVEPRLMRMIDEAQHRDSKSSGRHISFSSTTATD